MASAGNLKLELDTAHVERQLQLMELAVARMDEGLAVAPRHPRSERFHRLLPRVAELATVLDNVPTYAEWGAQPWVEPMRIMGDTLGALQNIAYGERLANTEGFMMEVAALALVARHRYQPDAPDYHAMTREMGELHDRKQSDYGRDDDPFANVMASLEWDVAPWVGAMIRLSDKYRRLQAFAIKGRLANESALDSLCDIAVYALIALILYQDAEAN